MIAEVTGSVDTEEDPVFTFCLNDAVEDDKNLVFTSHKSGNEWSFQRNREYAGFIEVSSTLSGLVRAWSGFGLAPSETLRCDHKGPISLLLAR